VRRSRAGGGRPRGETRKRKVGNEKLSGVMTFGKCGRPRQVRRGDTTETRKRKVGISAYNMSSCLTLCLHVLVAGVVSF
jgi:hypothetical protein